MRTCGGRQAGRQEGGAEGGQGGQRSRQADGLGSRSVRAGGELCACATQSTQTSNLPLPQPTPGLPTHIPTPHTPNPPCCCSTPGRRCGGSRCAAAAPAATGGQGRAERRRVALQGALAGGVAAAVPCLPHPPLPTSLTCRPSTRKRWASLRNSACWLPPSNMSGGPPLPPAVQGCQAEGNRLAGCGGGSKASEQVGGGRTGAGWNGGRNCRYAEHHTAQVGLHGGPA